MENENIEKTIIKLYESAPKPIQDALNSAELSNKIQEIGKIHSIHVDKLNHLYDQISMAMLGLEEPIELRESLKRKLELSDEKMNFLIRDINEKIFQPVKDSLKELYPGNEDLPLETSIYKTQHSKENGIGNETSYREPIPEIHNIQNNLSVGGYPIEKNNNEILNEKLNHTTKTEEKSETKDENSYKIDPYKEAIE